MSKNSYSYEVGTYRQHNYQIAARGDPSLNNIQSFAAVLFYPQADGDRVEVAKIDNDEHEEGKVHIDRYYREEGAERKDFSINASTLYEAEEYLRDNWRRFADLYEENHG